MKNKENRYLSDDTEELDYKKIRSQLNNRHKKTQNNKSESDKVQKRKNKKIYLTNKKEEKTAKRSMPISGIYVILILLIIGFIGFASKSAYNKAIASIDTPEKIAEKFKDSIDSEDIDSLMKIVDTKNGFDQDDAKRFLKLMKNNEKYKSDLINRIYEFSKSVGKDENYQMDGSIKLVKDKKKFLGKYDYKLYFELIDVNEDNPESIVSSIANAKKDNKFFPGIYIQSFKADDISFKREVAIYDGDLDYKDNAFTLYYNNFNKDQIIPEYEVSEGNKDITIRTLGNNDAEVFVDYKATGLTVDEFNDINPKNVPEGSILQIVKFENGDVTKSNPHELGYESWVILHLNFWNKWW
ncbi:MAG: hypothetical protein Q4B52_07755 [Tissierellia bacterium]|nr:hypothetical protein [Tissierellia bacterium]